MPEFLERKLKKRYGPKSAVPYKIMNSIGAMRGNKVTPKGTEMERKHEEHLHVSSPVRGLGLRDPKGPPKMKKKKIRPIDPFARAMNK